MKRYIFIFSTILIIPIQLYKYIYAVKENIQDIRQVIHTLSYFSCHLSDDHKRHFDQTDTCLILFQNYWFPTMIS